MKAPVLAAVLTMAAPSVVGALPVDGSIDGGKESRSTDEADTQAATIETRVLMNILRANLARCGVIMWSDANKEWNDGKGEASGRFSFESSRGDTEVCVGGVLKYVREGTGCEIGFSKDKNPSALQQRYGQIPSAARVACDERVNRSARKR